MADQVTEPTTDESNEKPCVGVLFVHGAGDHGIGSTLIEFGEPLVRWLDGWLRGTRDSLRPQTDAARPGATQIVVRESDSLGPAHTRVELTRRDGAKHIWLMAESRWDDAFRPPAFGQVLVWAIGVVPWTVLTQFIGPLIDESRLLRPEILPILRFFVGIVTSAIFVLVGALVLQALALAILVLSIIPLDPVRELVGRLQRFASTSVGDLYMVLTSPIQRAALASAVERDIDWMRQQGCGKVALVAHSQGGYVAYQALADPWHREVDLFVTLGSGLIRLRESLQAARSGRLLIALVGVLGAIVAIRFGPVAILGEAGIWNWERHEASTLAFFVGLAVASVLPVVIVRYQRDRGQVEALSFPLRWVDYITLQDPVLNGDPETRLPSSVDCRDVDNRASVAADHGAYWQNLDQFVTAVALEIGTLDDGLELRTAGENTDPAVVDQRLGHAWSRRRERVTALERARYPIAALTIVVVLLQWAELEQVGAALMPFIGFIPPVVLSWLPDLLRTGLQVSVSHLALLGALVVVGASFIGYRIGGVIWNGWTADDTRTLLRGGEASEQSRWAIAFYAWTILHLVLLLIVLVVGPAGVVRGDAYLWEQRNVIVQMWARFYMPAGLVAAAMAGGTIAYRLLLRRRPDGRLVRELQTRRLTSGLAALLRPATQRFSLLKDDEARWLGGGMLIVLAITFPIATVRGIDPPWPLAAAIGIAVLGLGLAIVGALSKGILGLFCGIAAQVQCWAPRVREARKPPFATLVDRLGILGILLAVGAFGLASQPEAVMRGAAVALAIIAAGLLVVLARRATVSGAELDSPNEGPLTEALDRIRREQLRWAGILGAIGCLAPIGRAIVG
jgi:hypothetical protein